MKTSSLTFASLLNIAFCMAQSQRLIVPALTNVKADAFGAILLPAYCIDATRIWPEYGHELTSVYTGSETTILTVRINKVVSNISLTEALSNKYVKLTSEEHAIAIIPLNDNIEILKLKTAGLASGEQDETFEYSNILHETPQTINPAEEEWKKNQKSIHRKAFEEDIKDANKKDKRIKEFSDNWVEKYDHQIRSDNWQVTDDNDVIKIHESKTPEYDAGDADGDHPFEGLFEFLSLDNELEGMSACITINPQDTSGIHINISGKLKGKIPIEIEFTSDNKFSLSAEMETEDWEAGNGTIKGSLSISKEFGLNDDNNANESDDLFKECKVSIAAQVCYPPENSSIDVEACGKTISLDAEGINFDF